MGSGRIHMGGVNPTAAASLAERVSRGTYHDIESARHSARLLEDGYHFYIKFGGGQNVARGLQHDLRQELTKIGMTGDHLSRLVEATGRFCVRMEAMPGGFPDRLHGANVEITELRQLARAAALNLEDDSPSESSLGTFHTLLDEFIRFRALQRTLMGVSPALFFDTHPLQSLGNDSVGLMLQIRRDITIADLEGVVAFWKSGDVVTPDARDGIIQVSDLLTNARKAGVI